MADSVQLIRMLMHISCTSMIAWGGPELLLCWDGDKRRKASFVIDGLDSLMLCSTGVLLSPSLFLILELSVESPFVKLSITQFLKIDLQAKCSLWCSERTLCWQLRHLLPESTFSGFIQIYECFPPQWQMCTCMQKRSCEIRPKCIFPE